MDILGHFDAHRVIAEIIWTLTRTKKITVDRTGESTFWQNIPGYLKGRDAIIHKKLQIGNCQAEY